jgi:hypothetical protein
VDSLWTDLDFASEAARCRPWSLVGEKVQARKKATVASDYSMPDGENVGPVTKRTVRKRVAAQSVDNLCGI